MFALRRGKLALSPEFEDALHERLARGLVNHEHLASILENAGSAAAAHYFRQRVPSRLTIRVGDFGEIVAGCLLDDEEGAIRLIEKLTFRDSRDWSMHLTDTFGVQVEADEITKFVFGEAKAGTTTPPTELAVNAYKRLTKDLIDEEPEILFFTLDRLFEAQKFESYALLDRAMRRPHPVPRAIRLILVFDDRVWDERVLSTLHDSLESRESGLDLDDEFVGYILTRDELRGAIDDIYKAAELALSHG